MFCEESLGRIKSGAFPKRVNLEAREKRPGDKVGNVSVHEFYLSLELALITLEQVNTTEWLIKDKNLN